MSSKTRKIGITGGIGAGKSIISDIFKILEIPVYDADSRAKQLMHQDSQLIRGIQELFGQEAYVNDVLNRQHIAKIAFNNPELLAQLNSLVHPKVAADYSNWHETHENVPYTLKEAALLFETGSYESLDEVILVTAPEAIRIRRVLDRDRHRTEADVAKIMAKQWPEDKKEKYASFLIRNDESQLVIPQVLSIHERLSQTSR